MAHAPPRTAPGADPGSRRAPARQVAALCWREINGAREVLLITSRDTGRWVVPKGWPMDGRTPVQAAMQEAWEEAGVRADAEDARHVGQFCYDKVLDNGTLLPVLADLFVVRLRRGDIADSFPEAQERERIWVSPQRAARLVDEPGLVDILKKF